MKWKLVSWPGPKSPHQNKSLNHSFSYRTYIFTRKTSSFAKFSNFFERVRLKKSLKFPCLNSQEFHIHPNSLSFCACVILICSCYTTQQVFIFSKPFLFWRHCRSLLTIQKSRVENGSKNNFLFCLNCYSGVHKRCSV